MSSNETGTFKIDEHGKVVKYNLTNKKFEIVKTSSSFIVNALIPFGIILVAGGLETLILSKKENYHNFLIKKVL